MENKVIMKIMKKILFIIVVIILIFLGVYLYYFINRYIAENRLLKEVISRLEADSRIAEVLVTGVQFDEKTHKTYTTIKFLEFDSIGNPLEPRYFTFSGNILQFQSLVIRFDDIHIRRKDLMRDKSAYIFLKVFMLDGANTQEYVITKAATIPPGYKIDKLMHSFEEKLWSRFWEYALNPVQAKKIGIKNAQIEAPGTMFVPGTIYTLKIEHDGGIRIDAKPLPEILKGEFLPTN